MGVILTFAGIFSGVNIAFVIGTHWPEPAVTTNALGHPASTVWIQTLGYVSLTLSLMAAAGAFFGKKWLNRYQEGQERGLPKERGIQRQMKMDRLERFYLPAISHTIFALLLISLLLFSVSLIESDQP